jgi:hypothetical protein
MAPKKNSTVGPGAVLKVGYNSAADIKACICGYEGCRKRLPAASEENPTPIACEPHTDTYKTAFSYMESEAVMQAKFNSEVKFGENVNRIHDIIHNGADNDCKSEHVATTAQHYSDVARDYGAWDLKELPRTQTPLNNLGPELTNASFQLFCS